MPPPANNPMQALSHPQSQSGHHGGTVIGPGPTTGNPYLTPSSGHIAGLDGMTYGGHGMPNTMEQRTNGRITYHMAQRLDEWQNGDTGDNQLIFTMRVHNAIQAHGVSYVQYSLSILNYMLKHDVNGLLPATRGKLNALSVLDLASWTGAQCVTPSELKNGQLPYSGTNGLDVEGRTRLHNIWLASDNSGCITEGCYLDLLIQRVRREPSGLTPQPGSGGGVSIPLRNRRDARMKGVSKADVDTEIDSNVVRAASQNYWGHLQGALAGKAPAETRGGYAAVDPEFEKTQKAIKDQSSQYYWRIQPYVSRDRAFPPKELYNGTYSDDPYNQYIGDFIRVGMAGKMLRGNSNFSEQVATVARRAVFPDTRSIAYTQDLRALDEIEVFLRK
jgi:hypothetical protein